MTPDEMVKKLSKEYRLPEEVVMRRIVSYFHLIGGQDRIVWDRKKNKYVYSDEYNKMRFEL